MNSKGERAGDGSPMDNPRVSHLLFVDDNLIFCKVNEKSCLNLRKLLNLYEAASSESISFSKSAMIFSRNVGEERGIFLSNILELGEGLILTFIWAFPPPS